MELRHPFLTNPRLTIFYGLFWLVASVVMVLIFTFANGIDFQIAFVEVFSFIIIYAFIGGSIWYVIKFTTLENNSTFRIFLAHIIAASIIVFIWMYLGVVIIKLFHPEAEVWIQRGMVNRIFGGYMMYLIFVVFFYAVNYYQSFKEKVRNEGKLISLVKEAELHALKSQINPHFLFNSFNTLITIIEENPRVAVEYVEHLSDYYRNILVYRERNFISLQEEMELVNSFSFLLQKRYEQGFKLEIRLQGKTGQVMPLALRCW